MLRFRGSDWCYSTLGLCKHLYRKLTSTHTSTIMQNLMLLSSSAEFSNIFGLKLTTRLFLACKHSHENKSNKRHGSHVGGFDLDFLLSRPTTCLLYFCLHILWDMFTSQEIVINKMAATLYNTTRYLQNTILQKYNLANFSEFLKIAIFCTC